MLGGMTYTTQLWIWLYSIFIYAWIYLYISKYTMLLRLIAKWYSRVSQVFKLRVVTWVSWRRKLRTFQFRFRWLPLLGDCGACRDFESEEGGIEGLSLRFRAVKSRVNWRCYPNEVETRKLPSRLMGLPCLIRNCQLVYYLSLFGEGGILCLSFVLQLLHFVWACYMSSQQKQTQQLLLISLVVYYLWGHFLSEKGTISILRILGISKRYTPMVHFGDPWN